MKKILIKKILMRKSIVVKNKCLFCKGKFVLPKYRSFITQTKLMYIKPYIHIYIHTYIYIYIYVYICIYIYIIYYIYILYIYIYIYLCWIRPSFHTSTYFSFDLILIHLKKAIKLNFNS